MDKLLHKQIGMMGLWYKKDSNCLELRVVLVNFQTGDSESCVMWDSFILKMVKMSLKQKKYAMHWLLIWFQH